MLLWLVSPVRAADFTVTNLNDSGAGSLRQAITDANSSTGADTINFQSGLSGTITLNSQLPTITDTAGLTIDAGSASITVSGNNMVRVFEVGSGAGLSLKNLTVAEGAGGAGAGILNRGTLEVTNSTFSGNSAPANSAGGGIANVDTLTVTNSTFSDNSALSGGGIFTNSARQLTVTNSTFYGNSASGGSDDEGGGIFANASPAQLRNTIVTNSPSGGNCRGAIIDDGYNLEDGTTCGFSAANNSQPSINPLLGPLADNGGPTQTHALLTGSPAIDKGNSFGATTDQRGESRPHDFPDIANATGGDGSDIGSFELQSQPALSINDITLTEGNSGTTDATFTVSLSKTSAQPVTVNYATADGTATAGTDYQSTTGTLTFAPGQTTQSVRVQVNGENVSEDDETFFVNLSNPTNATISEAQGKGTITNDDRTPDTTAPKVISTFPRDGGEVGPAANIRATFSEDMLPASVINAFKLFKKGSTTKIAAQVSYDAATDTATLNPNNNLRRGVTYKAVVTTVAKDVAGNRLDQNSSTAGLQQKAWFFEID